MERVVERTLWELLLARLGSGHRLLVVAAEGLDVHDVSSLKDGTQAGLARLRMGDDVRAFVGRRHEGQPVLLEIAAGSLHDVQPLSERRSRLSPLAGEA